MERTENKKGGWAKAAYILGIIAIIFALLPLLSIWFIFLTTLNYIIVPLCVIFGVIAFIKAQNMKKTIIGVALGVLAICLPWILEDQYTKSAEESVSNAASAIKGLHDAASASSSYDLGYEE